MEGYLTTLANGYGSYAAYLMWEVLHPGWHNYFYWLIGSSMSVWLLEILPPVANA